MITRVQFLPENRFGFLRVVAQHCRVRRDATLRLGHFDRARVALGQRLEVGDQFRFVEVAAFLVVKDAIVRIIFLPRRLVSRRHRIKEFLRSPH